MATKINSSRNIVRCNCLFYKMPASLCLIDRASTMHMILDVRFLFQSQLLEVVVYDNIWKEIVLQNCCVYESLLYGEQADELPSLSTPGLLVFISIFSRKKSELFLKKGDVIHSVLPHFIDYFIQPWSWIFLPRVLLQKMCTAAADIMYLTFCNKQFGKSHSGSSLLTLLLDFSYDRCLESGPKPDHIT